MHVEAEMFIFVCVFGRELPDVVLEQELVAVDALMWCDYLREALDFKGNNHRWVALFNMILKYKHVKSLPKKFTCIFWLEKKKDQN